jgi:hypothetical protein
MPFPLGSWTLGAELSMVNAQRMYEVMNNLMWDYFCTVISSEERFTG